MMEWPIEPEAAVELAAYSRRNPGRGYALLTAARNRAVATAREAINKGVAEEIITRLHLFPLGLTRTDVRVLTVLRTRPKGVGAEELCRATGISTSTFSGLVEPFLRLLGFVETLSRRQITVEGLKYLASLGLVDERDPEARAAIAQRV